MELLKTALFRILEHCMLQRTSSGICDNPSESYVQSLSKLLLPYSTSITPNGEQNIQKIVQYVGNPHTVCTHCSQGTKCGGAGSG